MFIKGRAPPVPRLAPQAAHAVLARLACDAAGGGLGAQAPGVGLGAGLAVAAHAVVSAGGVLAERAQAAGRAWDETHARHITERGIYARK